MIRPKEDKYKINIKYFYSFQKNDQLHKFNFDFNRIYNDYKFAVNSYGIFLLDSFKFFEYSINYLLILELNIFYDISIKKMYQFFK